MMEEIEQNIFLSTTFPQHFDQHIWTMISQQSAEQFKASQTHLLEQLLKDASLSQKYLSQFEQNHVRVYHWYLLASRRKVQIQPYVFVASIQNKQPARQMRFSKTRSTFPHRTAKTEPNKIKNLFYSPPKYNSILSEKIDSHQLFLQTVSACQGESSTAYNYHRHLKKTNFQKKQYNNFIRQPKDSVSNKLKPLYSSDKKLYKYSQWDQAKQNSSSICFRTVLANSKLNSSAALGSLLLRKAKKKIVFLNHQRKPVDYYLHALPKNI